MSETKNVKPLEDTEFKTKVLEASELTLVDFGADWCPPCRALSPILDTLAGEYQGRVEVFSMNVDANPETPASYQVRGLPTVILFKDGQPVDRIVGMQSKAAFENLIQKHLAIK